jgi:hypothetical protein
MQYILNSTFRSRYTIYCGGSLTEKIIIHVYLVLQSTYFLNFRSRYDMRTKRTAKKV